MRAPAHREMGGGQKVMAECRGREEALITWASWRDGCGDPKRKLNFAPQDRHDLHSVHSEVISLE